LHSIRNPQSAIRNPQWETSMQFALLGDHPHGLAMAGALAAAGHRLAAYSGPAGGAEVLRRRGLSVKPIGDLEEVLADPAVEAVIVAGKAANRSEQLRRALQSERHVLCVHPADQGPDIAYEAAMIQADTRVQLLPLMPEALHPAIVRLSELARATDGPLGSFRLVEMERWSTGAIWLEAGPAIHRPSLPGWDVLRALGGEIAAVSGFAAGEEAEPESALLLTGQFERGGLFQAALLPDQYELRWRLAVVGSRGRAELMFPSGWPEPARLQWRDQAGQQHEQTWETWDPWPALVTIFDAMIHQPAAVAQGPAPDHGPRTADGGPRLTWQDAVRCLELDDAARRSVERRRASALEYPEASEETGFKGTMTLAGCGLLWAVLLLLIGSAWVPWLGWLIIPVLAVFLGLQMLRWVLPAKKPEEK
jgi:predicted dehydrogenase